MMTKNQIRTAFVNRLNVKLLELSTKGELLQAYNADDLSNLVFDILVDVIPNSKTGATQLNEFMFVWGDDESGEMSPEYLALEDYTRSILEAMIKLY